MKAILVQILMKLSEFDLQCIGTSHICLYQGIRTLNSPSITQYGVFLLIGNGDCYSCVGVIVYLNFDSQCDFIIAYATFSVHVVLNNGFLSGYTEIESN